MKRYQPKLARSVIEHAPGNASQSRPVPTSPALDSERRRRLEILEIEHRQRTEFARIEHEKRLEILEAEAALVEEKCRRMAEEITPSNDRLRKMIGKFSVPSGTFDDEDSPY